MDLSEIANRYLSYDQKFIKGNNNNPIKSKELFFKIIKSWLLINKDATAKTGNPPSGSGFVDNFWVVIGSRTYYLNSDNPRNAIQEFYRNRENSWKVIPNRDGKKNLITNRLDGKPINGLYFYMQL